MKRHSRTTFLSLLGFLFIALLVAPIVAQEASTGLGLEVILKLHTVNVTIVQNNVTQPGFRPGDSGLAVQADSTVSTIYFQVLATPSAEKDDGSSLASPHEGYLVIQSFTMKVSPRATCYPFLQLRGQHVTFPLSIGAGIGNSIPIDVHYNCSVARTANISFAIDLLAGPNVSFAWEKFTSSNRLGFSVGTFLFFPDVVYNGIVLSDWSPSSHSMQVSAGILSTPFNFWMSLAGEKQVISNYNVTATPDYCNPYLTGNLDVIGNMLTSVLVVYNCSQNGTATITLSMDLQGGFNPLIAVWTKQSGGYRQDFLVGTQPGASDVIWWGLTLPLWSDYHFVMHPSVQSSTFYFVMNDDGDTQYVGVPFVTFDATVTTILLAGDLANGGVVNNTVQSLTVYYLCQVQGSTLMQISIPMPGYEPAVWRWTKQCGITRSDWNIGTRPGYDDVVSEGAPTFLYSPTLHSAFVFPDTSVSTFYFSLSSVTKNALTPQSGAEESEEGQFLPAIIKSIKVHVARDSCTPFLGGNATVGAEIPTSGWLAMTLTYNCTKPGNTNVSVTIVLDGPYAPATFSWLKRVGEGRNALRIGTIKGYDDVVSGGIATPLYSPSTFSAFYGPWQQSADFYLQLTNDYSSQVIKSITAVSSYPLACWPHIGSSWGSFGPWGYGGTLTGETPHHITVSWNCTFGVKVITNVTFELEDWGPLTVSMTVYSGGPRPYLDIGTMKGASDVVMGGIATPLWIPGPLNGATVSGNVLNTTFWLGMTANQTQYMFSPLMTVQTSDNILSPYLLGTFVNGGTVGPSFDQTLTVVYNCSKLGVVPISIGFLLPPFDSITFTWNKICSAERLGFSVGTTLGNNDVVQDGQPTMAWNPLTHVAFVVGTSLQTSFFVGETQGSQLISGYSVTSSLPICSPYIRGDLYPGIVLPENEYRVFTVVYNCSDIGKTNIQVTLQLSGNFMPVSFMWTKRVYGFFSGLNVGTTQKWPSGDVIYEGTPTFAYDPFSHTFLSEAFTSTYYAHLLSIPAPMQSVQFQPTVAFTFSPWLLPDVSGPLSQPYNFSDESTAAFSVTPHCLLSSELLENYASVFVAVTPIPFSPSIFSFFADCPPNVVGLTVGFDDSFDESVVRDGIPTGSWSPANTSRMEIEADFNILRFWVSSRYSLELASILIAEDGIIITEPLSGELHKVAKAPASLKSDVTDNNNNNNANSDIFYDKGHETGHVYNIITQKSRVQDSRNEMHVAGEISEDHFVVKHFQDRATTIGLGPQSSEDVDSPKLGYPKIPTPACRAILTGPIWRTLYVTNAPQELQIELNCTIGGTNNVSVILVPKDKSFSSTVWTFSKTMGGFRHGFDISVINPSQSLNSNTSSVVLVSGEATPVWTGPSPEATELSTDSAISFVLRLSRVYFGRDPVQDFFTPVIKTTPADACEPVLLGNASQGGVLQKNLPLHLNVLTNCFGVAPNVEMEVSIAIPPFTPAVFAWRRASTGVPPFLNADVQLSSSKPSRTAAIVDGQATSTLIWEGDTFKLWFYLNKGSLPHSVTSTSITNLLFMPPVVNTTTSNCVISVSGNATESDIIGFALPPLLLVVKVTNCSSPTPDIFVNVTAAPYTTPITIRLTKTAPAPAKPKFPGALIGIIIGSTLVIILAISVGLYLCLRRPATIPSTGAYHMKRRQQERKDQAKALLSDENESDQAIN